MYIFICTYRYIYMHAIYICLCLCIYSYIYIYIYVYKCVIVCVQKQIFCMREQIVCTYADKLLARCTRFASDSRPLLSAAYSSQVCENAIYKHLREYRYIYLCIYIYIRINIYTDIHIQRSSSQSQLVFANRLECVSI